MVLTLMIFNSLLKFHDLVLYTCVISTLSLYIYIYTVLCSTAFYRSSWHVINHNSENSQTIVAFICSLQI